jgi:hypothetical protein
MTIEIIAFGLPVPKILRASVTLTLTIPCHTA